MENQINTTTTDNTLPIEQNPTNQIPLPVATPVLEKKKTNYWMISTIILLVIVLIGIVMYFLNINKGISTNESTQSPESSSLPRSPIITKPNQIRIGKLQFTYPDQWTPLFSTPSNGKNVVYFAKNDQEVSTLSSCINQQSCSNYSLKVEDFADYAVWQNSTVEDFIKQVRSDIQLANLQKTTIDGHEAWLGYTDDTKTKHQTIIVTSTSQSKNFIAFTASTTVSGGMIEEYVTQLSKIKIGEYKTSNAKDLTTKNGFALEFTSTLDPKESDTSLLTFILDSLLAPENSSQSYSYLLYTATTKNADGSAGGANYPTTNYFNNKYYLLTDNDQLVDGLYGTPQIQIKLSTSSTDEIGLYLADPKYCRQDADCQYKSNFCSVGAYNQYHQYITPWGCGPVDFDGLGNSEALYTSLGCQTKVEVKYDSLKCISNSCQAVNAKAVCN